MCLTSWMTSGIFSLVLHGDPHVPDRDWLAVGMGWLEYRSAARLPCFISVRWIPYFKCIGKLSPQAIVPTSTWPTSMHSRGFMACWVFLKRRCLMQDWLAIKQFLRSIWQEKWFLLLARRRVVPLLLYLRLGIGRECARQLAASGATLIIAARSENRGQSCISEIIQETRNPNITYEYLDLSDFASVHALADKFVGENRQINILLNCAGLGNVDNSILTKDGNELMYFLKWRY